MPDITGYSEFNHLWLVDFDPAKAISPHTPDLGYAGNHGP